MYYCRCIIDKLRDSIFTIFSLIGIGLDFNIGVGSKEFSSVFLGYGFENRNSKARYNEVSFVTESLEPRILINHIINNGGRNEYNSEMIFSFRTNHDLANCINLFLLWSRHDRTNTSPDVGHMYRVNKVTERITDMEDAALVFNI
ncbi:hypothetical protein C1645_738455 [Glomus cerebriforme]|uniref:Uncharacterized protein n=1 Tax=Glomus cerebriforme TaxID=658196 RepID=A0A397SUN9_9GLOM|nr:hypothetical protein C1645_738455 [Glomus cerebriforme]